MENIFEALRADHEIQRDVLARLLETTGDSDDRRDLYDRLKLELTAHATHEEREFYVPLMENDLTQEKARHSVSEHKELDDFIEQLDDYDMSGSQWLQTARELGERLTHHLDEEEHEVFQLAGKVLNDFDKSALAQSYSKGMEEARAS